MIGNSVGRLASSPVHLLHRASQAVENVFASEVEIKNLTPRQLAVLMTVEKNEGISQTGLVGQTGVDRSTMTDIVRRLQKKGLLQRRRTKEDARTYAVKLTEEGRRVLRKVEPLAKGVDDRILGALPANQRDQFMRALASIVSALDRTASAP